MGSVSAVRPRIADVALTNISLEAIVELAAGLMNSLRPGGIVLASAFETDEEELIRAALPQVHEIRRESELGRC